MDLALDVYRQMLAEGCTPNLVTYNTLIDVYVRRLGWGLCKPALHGLVCLDGSRWLAVEQLPHVEQQNDLGSVSPSAPATMRSHAAGQDWGVGGGDCGAGRARGAGH